MDKDYCLQMTGPGEHQTYPGADNVSSPAQYARSPDSAIGRVMLISFYNDVEGGGSTDTVRHGPTVDDVELTRERRKVLVGVSLYKPRVCTN